jgi:hypothetical protein
MKEDVLMWIAAAYPDCDESGRHEANYSGNKECRIRNIYNWRTNIDEGIWQGWSNSQKQHIIEQVCSPFGYLHKTRCQFSYNRRVVVPTWNFVGTHSLQNPK